MSKQQHRRTSDITERLIGKIVAAKPASKTLKTRKDINSYLRKYFSDVPYEDMADRIRQSQEIGPATAADFQSVRAGTRLSVCIHDY